MVSVGKAVVTFRRIGTVVTTPDTVIATDAAYAPAPRVVGLTRTVRLAASVPLDGVTVAHSIAPEVPGGMTAVNEAVDDVPVPALMATV